MTTAIGDGPAAGAPRPARRGLLILLTAVATARTRALAAPGHQVTAVVGGYDRAFQSIHARLEGPAAKEVSHVHTRGAAGSRGSGWEHASRIATA